MISVKLLAATKIINGQVNSDFLALASHAALECYQSEPPELGKVIDVENRLFGTGHHTTLQHYFFTFNVEGLGVSAITLGMHLVSPFYNSDQRSGRFCAKMFVEPDLAEIEAYIKIFWPKLSAAKRKAVMGFIEKGVRIYQENIGLATEASADFIGQERPFANDKYIKTNAPKIAQEQLRVFISTIFPTGFDFTVSPSALAAMYAAAWSPETLFFTQKMADLLLEGFPEIAYMFKRNKKASFGDLSFIKSVRSPQVISEPGFKLIEIDESDFAEPKPEDMWPLDLLHFLPSMMDNSVGNIKTEIELSLACMGQDQRHRTIRRGRPRLTGNFYLPPVPKSLGLSREAFDLMRQWMDLTRSLPFSLAQAIAPYGAMVRYKKSGSLNAVLHEQNKRLCWCAQEEIYHLGRALRAAILEKNKKSRFARALEPHCFRTGKCAEGGRYCGRAIAIRKRGDYFPLRKV